MIIITIFFYGLLAAYELIPLYKQKLWRDLWITFLLGGCSFTFAILLTLGIKVPSPSEPIRQVVSLIFGK